MAMMNTMMATTNSTTIGVGFGTAALGANCYQVTLMALEAGFRKFDTAEAEWWYDQQSVGRALKDYFGSNDDKNCLAEDLRISTKIPPWSLTSIEDIREHARDSRQELVGFCDASTEGDSSMFPLDVYYIHAPACWKGWHSRCDNPPPTLNVYDAWMGMEYVIEDGTAKRIGLSNVHPPELRSIIDWIQRRQQAGDTRARLPDALQAYADPLQPATELRQICAQHNIEFVSYSTLGTQHRSTPHNPVLTHPTVQQLAQKYERSVAEIVLSWALQRNMSVIPRSSKQHHIQELARLLVERPTFLYEEDLRAIDNMSHQGQTTRQPQPDEDEEL